MAMAKLLTMLLVMEVIVSGYRIGGADEVSMQYYFMSCPFVEPVVRDIVFRSLEDDPTLAAAIVRMHFHDCFIVVLSLSLSHSLTHMCRDEII